MKTFPQVLSKNRNRLTFKGKNMFETIDKLFLAGLGALSMTRERAEKIFDEYVDRGKAESKNRSGFIKDMMDNADKTRKSLEKLISEQINETLGKLKLATKEDIQCIEKKLDQLLSRGQ
jgi:polyhydroxyalkanoate synthesis regulator phasin